MTEFNLSKKLREPREFSGLHSAVSFPDIKEFIKLLKEELFILPNNCFTVFLDKIDKLAGDDLI